MMKRFLLFALVVGLFAGQASAGMYEMDAADALNLRDVTWSDTTVGGSNILKYVGSNPGTAAGDRVYGTSSVYGKPMYYDVGFLGNLEDISGDGYASVLIGAKANTNGVLDTIKALGSFDSFGMPFSNDNDDSWQYKLYVDTTGGNYATPWSASLSSGGTTYLTLAFVGDVNFNTLTDIGFGIRLDTAASGNVSDDFHTSVVPVPGAVLLGMLGLSVAGLKLRKFA